MINAKRLHITTALVAFLAFALPASDFAWADPQATDDRDRANDDGDSDDLALDDGKALLPKAKLTFEQAKTAALTATSGEVEEIDLEYWKEKLVFDVDMGVKTVKIDAITGEVLHITDRIMPADQD